MPKEPSSSSHPSTRSTTNPYPLPLPEPESGSELTKNPDFPAALAAAYQDDADEEGNEADGEAEDVLDEEGDEDLAKEDEVDEEENSEETDKAGDVIVSDDEEDSDTRGRSLQCQESPMCIVFIAAHANSVSLRSHAYFQSSALWRLRCLCEMIQRQYGMSSRVRPSSRTKVAIDFWRLSTPRSSAIVFKDWWTIFSFLGS